MTSTETAAILIWFLCVMALFVRSSPRRAIVAGLIVGWLFLPNISVRIPGPLPDPSKASVTSLGLFAAVLLLDRTRLWALRPRLFDLPMLVWCLSPFATALANSESAYEGASAVAQNTIVWGIPYLLGRLYVQDAQGRRELAIGVFLGGLAYLPLCWFEILAGPQLAHLVYGYTPGAIDMAFRFGGWRPVVFMQHGLMVALWMAAASVSGFWLWRTGALPRVWRVPTGYLVLILCLTTLACKSVNAWVLLAFGLGILLISGHSRSTWLQWASVVAVVLYLAVRASGIWAGQELVTLTGQVLSTKTESIAFRMTNENALAQHARLEPLLGWGRWGRLFVPTTPANPVSAADSLWIIAFGEQGAIGLAAIFSFLLLPVVFLLLRLPTAYWSRAEFAAAAALAVIVLLFAIDNLANAMLNPIYMLAAGGLLTLPRPAATDTSRAELILNNHRIATRTHVP